MYRNIIKYRDILFVTSVLMLLAIAIPFVVAQDSKMRYSNENHGFLGYSNENGGLLGYSLENMGYLGYNNMNDGLQDYSNYNEGRPGFSNRVV